MELFGPIFAGWCGINWNNEDNSYWFRKFLSLAELWGGAILMFPLALKRTAGDFLRYTYAIPVISLLYILILMMVEAPDYITTNKPTIYYFKGSILDYLENIGIFVFGYNCITSYNYVFLQVSLKTKKRLDKITSRTMVLLWSIYLPIGIVAYYSVGDAMKKVDLFPNRIP